MAKSLFEELGGKYERQGDYLIPCIALPAEKEQPIGTWGQRHPDFTTGWKADGAASAALFSYPAPTGRNTVRIVPPGCAGGKRQNASGKDTMILRI